MGDYLASRNLQTGLSTAVTLVLSPRTTLNSGVPASALLTPNLVVLTRSKLPP